MVFCPKICFKLKETWISLNTDISRKVPLAPVLRRGKTSLSPSGSKWGYLIRINRKWQEEENIFNLNTIALTHLKSAMFIRAFFSLFGKFQGHPAAYRKMLWLYLERSEWAAAWGWESKKKRGFLQGKHRLKLIQSRTMHLMDVDHVSMHCFS